MRPCLLRRISTGCAGLGWDRVDDRLGGLKLSERGQGPLGQLHRSLILLFTLALRLSGGSAGLRGSDDVTAAAARALFQPEAEVQAAAAAIASHDEVFVTPFSD